MWINIFTISYFSLRFTKNSQPSFYLVFLRNEFLFHLKRRYFCYSITKYLSINICSSYDEYITEVRSGRLEWSPVHRSEKFWRENAAKLNDRNYELLKILINLLETSKDHLVLSVACFDLGEYVRHYQRGKQ